MEIVDKRTTFTVNDKWFLFTKEEADFLYDAVRKEIYWKMPGSSKRVDFFRSLRDELGKV